MDNPDILLALHPVIDAFTKLSIQYYIRGSIASSIYGMARATLDIDIIADIKSKHIKYLNESLKDKYYIDSDMISQAIRLNSSFNIIHLETMIKIDIFIAKDDTYSHIAIERRTKDTIEECENVTEFYFASPEDIILNKLEWYLTGGKVSERQWLDVVGVIKIQTDLLDRDYLKKWSQILGINALLKQAFTETGFDL